MSRLRALESHTEKAWVKLDLLPEQAHLHVLHGLLVWETAALAPSEPQAPRPRTQAKPLLLRPVGGTHGTGGKENGLGSATSPLICLKHVASKLLPRAWASRGGRSRASSKRMRRTSGT